MSTLGHQTLYSRPSVTKAEQEIGGKCATWCCGTPPLRSHAESIRPCAERLRLVPYGFTLMVTLLNAFLYSTLFTTKMINDKQLFIHQKVSEPSALDLRLNVEAVGNGENYQP